MNLLLIIACWGETSDDTSLQGEGRDHRDSVDTAPTPVYGCLRGSARDDYNVGEINVPVRVFAPDTCELLAEASGDVGGAFCVDGVPVGMVEVQVLYAEGRCNWWHGHVQHIAAVGDCETPTTCVDLETLFECYGDTPICETE